MVNYLNINLPRQIVEDFLCRAGMHCFPAAPCDKKNQIQNQIHDRKPIFCWLPLNVKPNSKDTWMSRNI